MGGNLCEKDVIYLFFFLFFFFFLAAGDKDTLEEVVQLQTFDEKSLLPPHIRKLCPEDLEIEPTEN